MSIGNHRPVTARASLRVEELESRDLLSVTVLPHKINLKSASPGNGVFTVRVISDTDTAKALLQGATPTFTVNGLATPLTPVSLKSKDLNHDGVKDLQVKFRRRDLAGLQAGEQTLTVTAADTSATTTTTPSGTTFSVSGSMTPTATATATS